jgi:hypothetical protein
MKYNLKQKMYCIFTATGVCLARCTIDATALKTLGRLEEC